MRFLWVVEKELNELLKEVFDSYESDVSEVPATADGGAEFSDEQLSSADDAAAPTAGTSKEQASRKLRSADHEKQDESGLISQTDAENNAFHYPGHIPPLKYVFIQLPQFSSVCLSLVIQFNLMCLINQVSR